MNDLTEVVIGAAKASSYPLLVKWLAIAVVVLTGVMVAGYWYFSARVDSLQQQQGSLLQQTAQMKSDIQAAQKWQQTIEKAYNDLRAANAQVDARTRQVETRVKTLRSTSPTARRYLDEVIPADVLSAMPDSKP